MTLRPTTHRIGLGLVIVAALTAAACTPSAPEQPQVTTTAPAAAPSPTMDHSHMAMGDTPSAMDPNAPMAEATVEVDGAFGTGKPVTVTLHITDMMSGKTMGTDAFELAHTKKMHVLGVDPSLTDYSHSHPEPLATSGDWRYSFTPKFNRPYHVWLDVKPVGGTQAYVMLALNEKGDAAAVQKTLSTTATVGNVTALLDFDAPLFVGQAAMGHLTVQRDGKPFAGLEPVMGAYSHIVGIGDDWSTIAHLHPMGTEPTKPSDRGGPAIDFHLEPKQAGFLKLFAQIQVDGRDVFLPFGVSVAPGTELTSRTGESTEPHVH